MKGLLGTISPVFAIFLLATGIARADLSKDERNLEREAQRLDDTASRPDGENAVVKKIASEFKVNDAQVQTLRNSRLGYGEISVILSLAQTMPGGITDANIQKVLAIRRGPPVAGWGQIAGRLDVKLGRTVSQLKKVNNESRREIKRDHARTDKAPVEPQPEAQRLPKQAPEKPRVFQGEGKSMNRGDRAN